MYLYVGNGQDTYGHDAAVEHDAVAGDAVDDAIEEKKR